MASVLLLPDNEGEDKHVESELIPRLDESSNLSSSTEKTGKQAGSLIRFGFFLYTMIPFFSVTLCYVTQRLIVT